MILSDKVQDEIRDLWQDLKDPVEIRFYGGEGDASANETMKALWDELQALNGLVQIQDIASPLSQFLPEHDNERQGPISEVWFDGEFSGIRYLGIPSGYEFGGLVDTVRSLSMGIAPHISEETQAWLKNLDHDLHLEVFVTPT